MILDFSRFDPSSVAGVEILFNIENLPKNPVVIDMKSINFFGYKDVAQGNPHHYYLIQIMIYANILDCEYGVLIYENKNDQKSCAFRINKSEALFQLVCEQAKEMNEMVEATDEHGNIHHKLPPPRPTSKESKECEWCQYRKICHNSKVWDLPDLLELRQEFYGDLLDDRDH